jgi:hypothetical protein
MELKPTSGLVTIEELIEIVPSFPSIAVTGPERSGTTITTEMICASTGYTNVSEETWDNSFESLWGLLRERDRIVVHAPHLTFRVHEIDRHCPDRVLVVFVLRAVGDIVASQRRNHWGSRSEHCPDDGDPKGWGNPASRWYDAVSYKLFRDQIDPEAHLCLNRQRCWHRHQKQRVRNYAEVEYETLRSHPLWLEPEERRRREAGAES